jgi:hypothetical protein
MTQRVSTLLSNRKSTPVHHILDVGGGRGDLATTLAMALPDCLVTVVDKNQPSLEAGRAYAEQLGLSSRMFFVHADFRDFHRDPMTFYSTAGIRGGTANANEPDEEPTPMRQPPPPINLVVALHACGDLSDLALAHAQQLSCPFVVCPCCYTKRYIDDFQPPWCRLVNDTSEKAAANQKDEDMACVLGRLAELSERPEVSRRAISVINSMRLFIVESSDCSYSVALEEYEDKSTKRNLVLVGAAT